jgi:prepilin-type processing-associated H-X9-DG protein
LIVATQMFAQEHQGYLPMAYNNGSGQMLGWSTRAGKSWEYSEPMWGWEYVLTRYMQRSKAIFKCPSDTSDVIRYQWNDATANLPDLPDADNVAASYRMNWSNVFMAGNVADFNQTQFISPKLNQLRPAASVIMFFDGLGSHADQIGTPNNENHVSTKTWDGRYNIMSTNPWNVAYRRHSRSLKQTYNDPYALKSALANYAFMDGHAETLTYNETWKPIGPNPRGGTNPMTPWQVTGWIKGLPQQD